MLRDYAHSFPRYLSWFGSGSGRFPCDDSSIASAGYSPSRVQLSLPASSGRLPRAPVWRRATKLGREQQHANMTRRRGHLSSRDTRAGPLPHKGREDGTRDRIVGSCADANCIVQTASTRDPREGQIQSSSNVPENLQGPPRRPSPGKEREWTPAGLTGGVPNNRTDGRGCHPSTMVLPAAAVCTAGNSGVRPASFPTKGHSCLYVKRKPRNSEGLVMRRENWIAGYQRFSSARVPSHTATSAGFLYGCMVPCTVPGERPLKLNPQSSANSPQNHI